MRSLAMPVVLPRRAAVGALSGLAAVALVRPAGATTERLEAAIREFAGEAPIAAGRVRLEVPPLVENGNAVPLTVSVEDAAAAPGGRVKRIAVFNERNPQPHVFTALFGPRAGRAALSTRIRLATSQRLVAVAETGDGRFWSDGAQVVVTLAACTEGG